MHYQVEDIGAVIQGLDEGGNAQRAGMRVGDVVTVSAQTLFAAQRKRVRDIMELLSTSEADSVRVRFERNAGAGVVNSEVDPYVPKRSTVMKGRGRKRFDAEIEKPVGMKLIELPGTLFLPATV